MKIKIKLRDNFFRWTILLNVLDCYKNSKIIITIT